MRAGMSYTADESFSIRRWIEGCEAPVRPLDTTGGFRFSIRRWIEGCEAWSHRHNLTSVKRFSIRRWIEGCEAARRSRIYRFF